MEEISALRSKRKMEVVEVQDEEKMDCDKFAERFSTIVNHGFVALEIGIGHRLGLFVALKKFTTPVTSQELADECKLKERYVREWLGCMTAAEIVSITDDNKYFIPEACKLYLELSYLASAMPTIAQNQKECINCFKKDGPKGYDYSINFDNLLWLAEGKTQCNRQWIDENLFPVGHIEKDAVFNVLDFGCGTGDLTLKIAEYIPNAKVIGVDIDQKAIQKAKENKATNGIQNVDFLLLNDKGLDEKWNSRFDWIMMVDVLHDLPNPESTMADIKRVLKQGGVISAIDPAVNSEHKMNVGNPQAAVLYVFSTLACLPSSMSREPAVGNGIGWGVQNKIKFLKSVGLRILNEDSPNLSLVHCEKGQ